jgi:hypothetical protein
MLGRLTSTAGARVRSGGEATFPGRSITRGKTISSSATCRWYGSRLTRCERITRRGASPQIKDLILYCNSSTEASHVFFALKYLLGYPKVRIYTGAWSEWAERMELPIE